MSLNTKEAVPTWTKQRKKKDLKIGGAILLSCEETSEETFQYPKIFFVNSRAGREKKWRILHMAYRNFQNAVLNTSLQRVKK